MSTRSILTVVGGVVGAYFGYPQLGLTIGALVGSAVDPQQIQGPKIGEIAVQTSQEGAPRTIVYGTVACFGNVIQTGQVVKVETSESQGKGGGPEVTSERALRTYAIRICEGPIGGVLRVWEDNKLVYDIRSGSAMLAESAKWAENKVFYLGGETQTPDPTLVASVDSDTPSYRGSAYMVFALEDLTERSGSIKQYRFEVAVAVTGSEVGGLTGSEVIDSFVVGVKQQSPIFMSSRDGDGVQVGTRYVNAQFISSNTPYQLIHLNEECNVESATSIPLIGDWHGAGIPYPDSVNILAYRNAYALVHDNTFQPAINGYNTILAVGGDYFATLMMTGIGNGWFLGDAYLHQHLWFSDTHMFLGNVTHDSIVYNNITRWPLFFGGASFPDATTGPVANADEENFWTHLGNDGKFRALNLDLELKTYSATLALETTETLPFTIAGVTLQAFAVDSTLSAFLKSVDFSSGNLEIRKNSDWSLVQTISNPHFGTQHGRFFRIVFTDTGLFVQCGDNILRYAYTGINGVGEPIQLSEIVSDIHDRCGIESTLYDVSELTDEVEGFSLAGDYTGASAIDSLRTVYFFDKSEHDKKLWYPKRGAAVIETLTIDNLTEVPDNTRRNQAIEVPKKLHLRYQHARSGYAPVKATAASSSPDFLTTGEVSIETAVVLDENEAAQTADKMYKITRTEIGGPTEITVPLNVGARYVTANNIGLSLRGATTRQRLEQIDFADWKLKFTLKPDRQSAYTSNLTGVPIPEPTPPPSTIVGPTELAILDIAARIDSEDDLNYLVAVSGRLPPWYGARYQRSLDAGATYTTVLDIEQASIMGEITNTVTDASEFFTDTTNTVNVVLYRDNQSIESITNTQFLSEGGAFVIEKSDGSWEIMQYRDAVEESDGSFTLSTLHRGMLNSGPSSHASGDRFVMLPRPSHIPAQSSWLNTDLTHRAISFGETADDTTNDVTIEFVGRSQIEWPVEYLDVEEDSAGLMSATWVPRYRFGTDANPINSINMIGYRVTIDDGSSSLTFDTTAPNFSNYDASSLGETKTVTVAALNRITGPGEETSVVV